MCVCSVCTLLWVVLAVLCVLYLCALSDISCECRAMLISVECVWRRKERGCVDVKIRCVSGDADEHKRCPTASFLFMKTRRLYVCLYVFLFSQVFHIFSCYRHVYISVWASIFYFFLILLIVVLISIAIIIVCFILSLNEYWCM